MKTTLDVESSTLHEYGEPVLGWGTLEYRKPPGGVFPESLNRLRRLITGNRMLRSRRARAIRLNTIRHPKLDFRAISTTDPTSQSVYTKVERDPPVESELLRAA